MALSAGLALGFAGLGAVPGHRPAARSSPPLRVLAGLPDDPGYAGSQAHYLGALNLPAAWDRTTGSDSVVAAVLDTGVDPVHPDLIGHLVPGRNVVADNDDTTDDIGHGTKMAGILGAVTNNGLGVAGVAWSVRIMPVKVTGPSGTAYDASVAAGIRWAVDHHARVVNLSLGAPGDDDVLGRAVDYATAHDVLVVAAAGNNNSDVPEFPAACRGVVAVGATDASGNRAPFSNSGPWVDVNAPGVDIFTTKLGGGYTHTTGTSAATALVAGVAVLLRSADPFAAQGDIADRLRRSALGRGPVGRAGIDASGVVDAAAALRLPGRRAPSGPTRAGYLMIADQGKVDSFGDLPDRGDVWGDLLRARAVAVESRPPGDGYW
ncbi:MAG TPA: S8 family serine peptidase, partial [Acidimicrobiia bacterium]|nr:S8 family serine peptidase [Acidimicrobiia bacterium]